MLYYTYSSSPEKVFHITSDDGDSYYVKSLLPALKDFDDNDIHKWGNLLCNLFNESKKNNGNDITSIIYDVYIALMYKIGFSCKVWSDNVRTYERKRIGKQIKDMRLKQKMEAKKLAELTGIDAANICRIEQGSYSVGYDILAKIALALGARLELVPYEQNKNTEL